MGAASAGGRKEAPKMRSPFTCLLRTSLPVLLFMMAAAQGCGQGDLKDGSASMGGGDGGPSPGQMSPAGITPEPVMTETVVPANYWPKGVDQGITDPSLGFRALMVFQVKAPT